MTALTLKKQLHKAIDSTDDEVFLKAVYTTFKEYGRENSESLLSEEQKNILDQRLISHQTGKSGNHTINEVRKTVLEHLKNATSINIQA